MGKNFKDLEFEKALWVKIFQTFAEETYMNREQEKVWYVWSLYLKKKQRKDFLDQ